MAAAGFYKIIGNVESKALSFEAVVKGYDSLMTPVQYNPRFIL